MMNTLKVKQEDRAILQPGNLIEIPQSCHWKRRLEAKGIFLGGGDSYKIDYSGVAAKSRCVAGIVNITCIINRLSWSGRRDLNP